jgi:hypothetical protein
VLQQDMYFFTAQMPAVDGRVVYCNVRAARRISIR